MTLVKSAPKKSLFRTSISKIVFWQKPFLGTLFTKVIYTFLKSIRKDGFLMPHSTYSKKKSFHLLEWTMNFLENWKSQKWKEPLKISKNGFLKTNLRFFLPFQNFMPHIKILKFCQNHWSLVCSKWWEVLLLFVFIYPS